MKYGVLNLLLGVAWTGFGLLVGGWAVSLVWLGFNFLVLGSAYLLRRPSLLGKRPDGSLALWSWLLLLPLHLFTLAVWHLARIASKEPATGKVSESLHVGRRLLNGELPQGIATVVDLTAEFAEPRRIVGAAIYRSFPIMDGFVPAPGELRGAQGHGRTGLVATAFLLLRGHAKTVTEAVSLLQAVRPGISLKSAQKRVLSEMFPAHS